MKNLLFRRYQKAMNRPYADGGALSAYGQIGAGLIDAIDKPDQFGGRSMAGSIGSSVLSSAGTGAAIGSAIPGVGTALGAGAGALVGAVSGFFRGRSNNQQARNLRNAMAFNALRQANNYSAAQLAADPTLATGTNEQSYFKHGGGIHIKPSHRGRFTAYLKRTGSTLSEALHSKNAHVRQMANFARNAKKWKHEDGGPITMREYVKAGTTDPGFSNQSPFNDLISSGGNAKALSSDNSIIKGKSHADGGVVMDALNTEVEGGESTLNNFVFSKKLGYAQQHIPIAKAKGKIEKKPRTLERANSLRRLMQREQELAQQQEAYKAQNGLL